MDYKTKEETITGAYNENMLVCFKEAIRKMEIEYRLPNFQFYTHNKPVYKICVATFAIEGNSLIIHCSVLTWLRVTFICVQSWKDTWSDVDEYFEDKSESYFIIKFIIYAHAPSLKIKKKLQFKHKSKVKFGYKKL